jgi:peptidoglycan/LPS O-acetylase OafA/YrhL
MQFDKNINGLRALAVAVVVLYHLSVPGFGGGFVGVDVFFVISGYLMTAIVLGRLADDTLSIRRFYAERVRRIVPALLALCLVLLVIGWFLLLPSDYRKLGKQVGGSLGFVSNILYWREAGYFADVSHRNWLLHTWSLAVEWQFYLLYPLLLTGLYRLGGVRALRWGLPAVAAASFALSTVQSIYASGAAFFLLPSRAWQLLAGALVYLFPSPGLVRRGGITEVAGLALVLSSVALLDPGDPWPGWRALAASIGTALVIASRRDVSALLDNAPVQWVGRISYSVYLWHWPLVVGLTQMAELSAGVRAFVVVALSLLLGHVSFRFIETPSRRGTKSTLQAKGSALTTRPTVLAATLLTTALGGAAAWATEGVPWRFAPAVRAADLEALNMNPHSRDCFATAGAPVPACVLGNRNGRVSAQMLGDSHALTLVSALVTAAPGGQGAVVFRGYASCPTLIGATYGPSDNHCFDFNREALAALTRGDAVGATPLVVTNNWTEYITTGRIRFALDADDDGRAEAFSTVRYRAALLRTACALSQHRRVYLTLPLPRFDIDVPRVVAYRLMRDPAAPDPSIDLAVHRRRNAEIVSIMEEARDNCGVRLLDPTPYLCPDGECRASIGGRPLYTDGHHLSEYGNQRLVPMFREVFDDA